MQNLPTFALFIALPSYIGISIFVVIVLGSAVMMQALASVASKNNPGNNGYKEKVSLDTMGAFIVLICAYVIGMIIWRCQDQAAKEELKRKQEADLMKRKSEMSSYAERKSKFGVSRTTSNSSGGNPLHGGGA